MKSVEKLNLLFDLDGTLSDNKPGIIACIHHACDRLGMPWTEPPDTDWCIGPPLKDTFGKILGSGNEGLVPQAIELYRERYRPTGIFENTLYEGIAPALEALGEKADLYVATSKVGEFAKTILKHFKVDHHFKRIYGSELDGTLGDKVQLLRHLIKTEKLAPASTFMIGDREHDMKAAVQNGIKAVGAGWGFGTREELWNSGALEILETPSQLLPYFKQRPAHET